MRAPAVRAGALRWQGVQPIHRTMFERLKSLFAPRARAAARPDLAPGVRLYAVGDVHGQDDLLGLMLARLRDDALAAPAGTRCTLIMLGDYIDRGLGSARVIERLSTLSGLPFDVRFLKGNHEEAMLDFLADPAAGPVWVQYGGGETLAGYGVKPPAAQAGPQAWQDAHAALTGALPAHHRAFLEGLEPFVVEGPYMFVHAGVDPAKSLAEQSERDFYWIREKFLHSTRRFEYVVVHGHTPEQDYHHDERRIGIDTGAYLTGVLTAVRLEGDDVTFLQSRRGER
ncbi:metallophosphoesterase [Glycocaulis sp.]|uniref:metallophosphoesterase n=1 Tax=Glycocaulis sp. TaxID=1969725 RepID=UPI003F703AE8